MLTRKCRVNPAALRGTSPVTCGEIEPATGEEDNCQIYPATRVRLMKHSVGNCIAGGPPTSEICSNLPIFKGVRMGLLRSLPQVTLARLKANARSWR